MDVVIFDGYVDEPAALGVRPFLHPVVRGMWGAALDAGARVHYLTIDDVRSGRRVPSSEILALHAGSAVPGRYLRSMPASAKEIRSLMETTVGPVLLGGPAAYDPSLGERAIRARRDPAAALHDLLVKGRTADRWRTLNEWNRWLLLGSELARLHPDFPEPLIVEIETYRGCLRHESGGCSFCMEPLKGKPLFREVADILSEVKSLLDLGVRNLRLGAQTCFVSYLASSSRGKVVPNPSAVERLLSGVAKLGPRVLHLDNANPAVIADNPEESRRLLGSVVDHCTSGNALALGMESADPRVIEANHLNASPEQVMDAIRIINEVGAERGETGLPRLLPGLNFISGLDGEREETFQMNLDFLREVIGRGYLLRRINIRQVMCIRRDFGPGVGHAHFRRFKEAVREEIDRFLLERIVPFGTVLKDVYIELREGNHSFGRQIGTYPLLVGFEYPMETERFVNAAIVGWGYRSVTAIQHPLMVNRCPMSALSSLPGIGRKRAMRIVRARPMGGMEDLAEAIGERGIAEKLEGLVSFDLS